MAEPTPAAPSGIHPVSPVPSPERHPRLVHLPAPLTSFVGRGREIAAVAGVLSRPGVRLVTLIGPGGVGKTRLAIRVAEAVADAFPDGVWFVALAAVRDPALVAAATAHALGVQETGARTAAEATRTFLRERRALLVLDNFEHVLDAGPSVTDLLNACSDLTVLVTSRAVLRLSGEHVVTVPPLSLSGAAGGAALEEPTESEAVRLFVERARATQSDFSVTAADAPAVAEICLRVDGLPLAIELAAARVDTLPPRALLARLDRRLGLLTGGPRDAPARLRSMRDAIEWSHDFLDASERTLFRRLSVFVGGFTLEAAEAVAGAAGDLGVDDLDGVASLVAKSLLRRELGPDGETRFVMLETIREFGLERLAASGEEEAVRRRHAAWFLSLAEENRFGAQRWVVVLAWLDRLECELGNLRAALSWADQTGDIETGLRLAGALYDLWNLRSHRTEGRDWLVRFLAHAEVASVDARAAALETLGALESGIDDRAIAHLEESLVLAETVGDRKRVALVKRFLSIALWQAGRDYERAESLLLEAEPLTVEIGDEPGIAWTRFLLGAIAARRGKLAQAEALVQEALARFRDLEEPFGATCCLDCLGLVVVDRGDPARAASFLIESLARWRELRIKVGLVEWLSIVAVLAAASGRREQAVRWLGAAEALGEHLGHVLPPAERARYQQTTIVLRSTLGEATFAAAWSAGKALSGEEATGEALALLTALTSERDREANDADSHAGLTRRERQVLRYLGAEATDREIAAALFISPRTVGAHVTSILRKLGVETRRGARVYARTQNRLTARRYLRNYLDASFGVVAKIA